LNKERKKRLKAVKPADHQNHNQFQTALLVEIPGDFKKRRKSVFLLFPQKVAFLRLTARFCRQFYLLGCENRLFINSNIDVNWNQ